MEENIVLKNKQTKKYYENLNGLRAIAAMLIPFMHIFTNCKYEISNSVAINVIMNLADFVRLFFILGAFGMCCGYYDKIKNRTISMEKFYSKRYRKIFPFFACLVLLDFIVGKGTDSLYEVFADLTLAFGLLPNSNIQVIGVGWTLGVIFAFYMLFPFFVFCIDNKKRAWFSFVISLVFYYSCKYYFLADGRPVGCNFLMWSSYFVAGGLIYLYKEKIIDFFANKKVLLLIICCIAAIVGIAFPKDYPMYEVRIMACFILWILYAISVKSKILDNKITKFISDISFEVYLSHMIIFRVIEKLNLVHLSSNDVISYLTTVFLVLCGDIIFVVIAKKVVDGSVDKLLNKRNSKVEALEG